MFQIYQIWHFYGGFLILLVTVQPLFGQGHEGQAGAAQPPSFNPEYAEKLYDFDHIKEHYEGEVNLQKDEVSKEELGFHFFQQHDLDKDNKMDGLELLQAFRHMLPYKDFEMEEDKKLAQWQLVHKELNFYTDIIDSLLNQDDYNQDGYLNYHEFTQALRGVGLNPEDLPTGKEEQRQDNQPVENERL